MWLLYADETNLDPKTAFFVYGGIAVPGDRAGALDDEIDRLRKQLNVPQKYVLKFNPGPEGMSHADFIALKSGVLNAAAAHGASLFVTLTHHGVIKGGDVEAARRMAIDRLIIRFDAFMHRQDDRGLVLLDRFSDKKLDSQLQETLSVGLRGLPYSTEYELKKIVGIHLSAIGQSHFCSLVDVALGSLRFALNAFTSENERQLPTAATLLGLLSPLLLRFDGGSDVHELSLSFSPKNVKSDAYRADYVRLAKFLADHGIVSGQARGGFIG